MCPPTIGKFAERAKRLLAADELDPPFVGMMTNGTSGNINNINFREVGESKPPYAQMQFVADKVAQNVFDAAQNLEWHDRVTLDAVTQDLQLGVRKPSAEDSRRRRKSCAKPKAAR